jgi:chromosome segregation ATPase
MAAYDSNVLLCEMHILVHALTSLQDTDHESELARLREELAAALHRISQKDVKLSEKEAQIAELTERNTALRKLELYVQELQATEELLRWQLAKDQDNAEADEEFVAEQCVAALKNGDVEKETLKTEIAQLKKGNTTLQRNNLNLQKEIDKLKVCTAQINYALRMLYSTYKTKCACGAAVVVVH